MIAILTYDAPHRKTQDIIINLIMSGYRNITVIATPWIEKKPFYPLYYHRPGNVIPISLAEYCNNLNLEVVFLSINGLPVYLSTHSFEYIIIGGAGILPKEVVENRRMPHYLEIQMMEKFERLRKNSQSIRD